MVGGIIGRDQWKNRDSSLFEPHLVWNGHGLVSTGYLGGRSDTIYIVNCTVYIVYCVLYIEMAIGLFEPMDTDSQFNLLVFVIATFCIWVVCLFVFVSFCI